MTVMSDAHASAKSLRAIAQQSPQVHCITNAVALSYTANMLLAVGAMPTMSMSVAELPHFVGRADTLSINLGTLDQQRRDAIAVAVETATTQGKPWVLDPVLVDVSRERYRYAQELLTRAPAVIRGNAAEIVTLAGEGRGQPAERLARRVGTVVAQTGAIDVITDGDQQVSIANGHHLMTRVTAMGCALSALVTAFLAVESDALTAAVQALLVLGVAGELAAKDSAGPGSLQTQILDQLYGLDQPILESWGRVTRG